MTESAISPTPNLGLDPSRHLELGVSYIQQKLFGDALEQFRYLLSRFPRKAPDVIMALDRLLVVQPENVSIRLLLCEIYLLLGYRGYLHTELDELMAIDQHNPDLYILIRKAYQKLGPDAVIIRILESAIEHRIFEHSILDILPQIYSDQQNVQKSISLYHILVREYPDQVPYKKILAELHRRDHDYDTAATLYCEIVEQAPDSLPEAIEFCETLVKYVPRNRRIRILLIEFLFKRSLLYEVLKHCEQISSLEPEVIPDIVPILKRATETFPGSVDLLVALATLLIRNEQVTEGVDYLNTCVHVHAADPGVVLPVLDDALAVHPEHRYALELMTELYISQGNSAKALHILSTLVNLQPAEEMPRLGALCDQCRDCQDLSLLVKAKITYRSGDSDDAIRILHQLHATQYGQDAKEFEAYILDASGQHEAAMELIRGAVDGAFENAALHEKAVHIRQSYLDSLLSAASQSDASALTSALVSFQSQDFEHAISSLQSIPQDHPNAVTSQILIGRCFVEMGRFDLAITQLRRLLVDTGSSPQEKIIRYLIALAQLNMGHLQDAIQELETVLQLDIHFLNVTSLLDRLKAVGLEDLRGRGVSACFDSASQHTLHILSVQNPENLLVSKYKRQIQTVSFAHTHNNQGVDHLFKRNTKAAEDEFQLAVQLDPHLTVAHCNLALLYSMTSQFNEAESSLNDAARINPDNPLVQLNSAILALAQANFSEAFELFSSGAISDNHHAICDISLGDIHYHRREFGAAFKAWNRALDDERLFYLLFRRMHYLAAPTQNPEDLVHDFLNPPIVRSTDS